jgi:hypothetical protein
VWILKRTSQGSYRIAVARRFEQGAQLFITERFKDAKQTETKKRFIRGFLMVAREGIERL